MIINSIFRKAVLVSLLGHITLFTIFSFSFGKRIASKNYADGFFWGAILRSTDLLNTPAFSTWDSKKLFIKRYYRRALDKINRDNRLLSTTSYYFLAQTGSHPLIRDWWEKPAVTLTKFNESKTIFIPSVTTKSPFTLKRESTIMLHPLLPYHFLLYFKDRQVVHIELMFNIKSTNRTNSIVIKRKISSGNLEADLLSMRYISHYLFIQKARFIPNIWQIVKIELSPRND